MTPAEMESAQPETAYCKSDDDCQPSFIPIEQLCQDIAPSD
jgi:hypothetical protein